MTENDISREIVDTAFQVHTKLGPGLLETVYEVIMARKLGLLINFGENLIKDGISRVVNGLDD